MAAELSKAYPMDSKMTEVGGAAPTATNTPAKFEVPPMKGGKKNKNKKSMRKYRGGNQNQQNGDMKIHAQNGLLKGGNQNQQNDMKNQNQQNGDMMGGNQQNDNMKNQNQQNDDMMGGNQQNDNMKNQKSILDDIGAMFTPKKNQNNFEIPFMKGGKTRGGKSKKNKGKKDKKKRKSARKH
jgi:hypothetical protein